MLSVLYRTVVEYHHDHNALWGLHLMASSVRWVAGCMFSYSSAVMKHYVTLKFQIHLESPVHPLSSALFFAIPQLPSTYEGLVGLSSTFIFTA